MTLDVIRSALDNAWHEIGHALAFVGSNRFLAAENAVDSALESLKLVHDALYSLPAPHPDPLTPEEELADTIKRQKELDV